MTKTHISTDSRSRTNPKQDKSKEIHTKIYHSQGKKLYAKEGCNLLLIDFDEKVLIETSKEIKNLYKNIVVETLISDLSKKEELHKIEEYVSNNDYFVNNLINCAGFGEQKDFIDMNVSAEQNDSEQIFDNIWKLSVEGIQEAELPFVLKGNTSKEVLGNLLKEERYNEAGKYYMEKSKADANAAYEFIFNIISQGSQSL